MFVPAAVTAGLFVFPGTSRLRPADAVIVPSGDHGERLTLALGIIDRGFTSTLVFLGALDSPEARSLCARTSSFDAQSFRVVCVDRAPDSTRTEARSAAALATEMGWKTVILATSTQHVARAGLLFRRCVRGTVLTAGARPPYGLATTVGQIAHEWGGLLHALTLARGC